MPAYPAFCDGSYRVQNPVTSQTALINWYTEVADQPGTVSKKSLLPTPGVEAFATVTGVVTGGRAMYDTGAGRTFSVMGNKLVEILADQSFIDRGSLDIDANPATIVTNGAGGNQLFITSGGKGYNYELDTNVLTEIADLVATQGGMLYGYFVAFDRPNSRIRISDLFDGSVWDPTQFAERTIGSDDWQAMCVTSFGQICLPGSKTGEFWFNSGAFPFPFAPDPSALFSVGIAATFSIKEVNGGVCWLASSSQGGYTFVVASGTSPQPISDKGLEYEMSQYSDLSDGIVDAYDEQGHSFLTLTLPTANVSWTYDFSTRQWHRRGTWISEQTAYTYWRPVYHCFSFGKHLMADRETNVIYHMSNDFGLDVDSRVIRRLRRAPALNNEHLRLRYSRFELLVESGLGTTSGAGENPQIMFRQSSDFGKTWGNELQTSLGREGHFSERVMFWRIGQARGKVFEISTTAVTPARITDAYLRILKSTEAA
jgi:hypothetical protein